MQLQPERTRQGAAVVPLRTQDLRWAEGQVDEGKKVCLQGNAKRPLQKSQKEETSDKGKRWTLDEAVLYTTSFTGLSGCH